MRRFVLANNYVYHVFNRGIERRLTFTNKREYLRALMTLEYYQYLNPPLRFSKALLLEKDKRQKFFDKLKKEKKLVDVISFCLMPNHFHILLKQKLENGISKFLSNFSNSYTRYFNTKHKRTGPLFEGIFKAVFIETDEQLIHVSRYIHLNPVASLVIKDQDLDTYPWSSFPEYIGNADREFCNKDLVFSQFSSKDDYRQFVYDRMGYAKQLEKIKHLILE